MLLHLRRISKWRVASIESCVHRSGKDALRHRSTCKRGSGRRMQRAYLFVLFACTDSNARFAHVASVAFYVRAISGKLSQATRFVSEFSFAW